MDNKREELVAYKLSYLGWNHQKVQDITNYKAVGCRHENVIMFVQDLSHLVIQGTIIKFMWNLIHLEVGETGKKCLKTLERPGWLCLSHVLR